jgi:hypothetical protein
MPRGQYDRTAKGQEETSQEPLALPPRAVETRRERRRRDDGDTDVMARMKLAIPREIREQLEREGKTARWVRNDPGRMQQLHNEDWDIVEGFASVSASRSDESQMILMSKSKDWYDADRAHLQVQNDGMKDAALAGRSTEATVDSTGFYSPKTIVNQIA